MVPLNRGPWLLGAIFLKQNYTWFLSNKGLEVEITITIWCTRIYHLFENISVAILISFYLNCPLKNQCCFLSFWYSFKRYVVVMTNNALQDSYKFFKWMLKLFILWQEKVWTEHFFIIVPPHDLNVYVITCPFIRVYLYMYTFYW